jgi:DNA polymerase V
MQLVRVALWGLQRIYRSGYRYQKAGVMLGEIVPADKVQTDLFSSPAAAPAKSTRLMTAMDSVNRHMGKQSLVLASQGFSQPWKMKQENRSPAYTTNWDELPVAW